ncbi:hypothetical protein FRC01_012859 [Tulasnella sp. 417]|nr:hypothetical protein FRC01_012859 [Tulasnella sp. 417]
MALSLNRLALERMADEAAAQAFGVGFNDLHAFIMQKSEGREGGDMIKTLDALLCRLFQHRNRLLRLHLLPDEILLHIFKLAVEVDWDTDMRKYNSIHYDLKTYYKSLCPIQRVCKRWHDIIVSYAPFWSLISSTMPKNMIELALARARDSTLSVGVQHAELVEPSQFIYRVLQLSNRVENLSMDHGFGGSDIHVPLWTRLPNIQNLRLADVDGIPHKELDGSAPTTNIPSPRQIHLFNSMLPTIPTLYSQVEELVIEYPSETLTNNSLKLIAEGTPRLRVLRFDDIRNIDAESLNDPLSLAPMPMPNLRLLHISRTRTDGVAWLLNRFRPSPRTSIRIHSWDRNISPFKSQIRDRIWAALDSTMEQSFALDLAPWAYKFQTRNMSIEIEISTYENYPSILARSKIVEGRQDGIATLSAVIHCLQYSYNRLQPVDALPDELLLNIFKLVVENFITFDEYKNPSHFREKLKSYHTALYPLRAVCRRWCEVVSSYGPFWAVFDSRMPEEQITLGLSRSGSAPLTVAVFKRLPNATNKFIERMAALSERFSHLILDLVDEEVAYKSALWAGPAPNLQKLSIRGANANLFPTPGSCFKGTISSLRRLYLGFSSIVPTAQELYQRLEELTIESPSQALTVSMLDSILRGASRLRVLQFRLILMPIMASIGTLSGQIAVPSLLGLSIEMTDSLVISQLLSLFRLTPRTSLRIACADSRFNSFETYIRRHMRAIIRSTKEKSFCLNISPNTYFFRTYYTCVSLQVPSQGGRRLWPNYFANFSLHDGRAPIRVYLFLKTEGASDQLPDPQSIAGLQNDFFVLM